MAGSITVDTIQSDSSYASTLNVASKINFTSGMQVGGQDTTFGGMRNRIINGDMRIDQRNAGASVTASTATYTFITDRFKVYSTGASKLSGQRTTTAPTGFNNSLAITSLTATSPAAGDEYQLYQNIEGYNIADLGWGTASAQTVTLSFWVRSSLTGTFAGCLYNSGGSRCYVFTYTISAANTFEYKSITIAGDTSGTWLTTNLDGINITWDLGSGSNLNGTAGVWASAFDSRTSGSVTLVGTNGATFYITGVQLEKGSAATAFEYRQYGTELALCQRYYYQANQLSTYSPIGVGRAWGSGNGNAPFYIPVAMRSNPTITYSSLSHFDVVTLGNPTAIQNDGAGTNNVKVGWAKAVTSGNLYQFEFGNQTTGWLGFSSEL